MTRNFLDRRNPYIAFIYPLSPGNWVYLPNALLLPARTALRPNTDDVSEILSAANGVDVVL